ncbi:hypothetical protein CHCC14819_0451 [Bacillus licheniformis]|uniref:hypothetical protein n=1 Tax=Bacillus licheniformis TaxID=1402 RepID=UPI00119E8D79|nr:hypothetical protein [Bacillus licheniformis]TWM32255.1 hypothetical protein CHCC14819_0451 [Bacillus licheniformis]
MARETYKNVRKNRFTQVGNGMLWDKALTLQAKGLLSIFLSNSEDWDLNMREIIKRSKNGRDAHYKIVDELIQHGYFARIEIRNEKNQFEEMIYIFSDDKQDVQEEIERYKESNLAIINPDKKGKKGGKVGENSPHPENQETGDNPLPENQETENQDTGNQYPEIQFPGNQDNNNTISNNTILNNTNLNKTKDNNINLSNHNRDARGQEITDMLNEMMGNKDMPVVILKQLSTNIDRLTDDNINPYEVLAFYNSSDNTVGHHDFAMILSNVLKKTKGTIGSFHAVMKTAIKNWYNEYEEPSAEDNSPDENLFNDDLPF